MFAQTFTRKYRERMKYVHAFDINRHPPAKRTKCQRHYCELPILVYFSFILKLKIAKAKQSREVGSRLVMLGNDFDIFTPRSRAKAKYSQFPSNTKTHFIFRKS